MRRIFAVALTLCVAVSQGDWVKVIELSGGGSKKSAPIVFPRAKYYGASFNTPGNCYYSLSLKPIGWPDQSAEKMVDITRGDGPNKDSTYLYDIKPGVRYYLEVITGSAKECPWKVVLNRTKQ